MCDWDAVELEYRAGVLPLSVMAQRHGVTVSKITSTAKRYNWGERQKVSPATEAQAHALANKIESVPPKFPIDSILVPGDVEMDQVQSSVEVLLSHRTSLRRMRKVADKMLTELESAVNGERPTVTLHDYNDSGESMKPIAPFSVVMSEKTPADLLEKLSRVMVRLVGLERQAFGLDTMLPPDESENTDLATQSQLHDVFQQLQQLTQSKSGLATHDRATPIIKH